MSQTHYSSRRRRQQLIARTFVVHCKVDGQKAELEPSGQLGTQKTSGLVGPGDDTLPLRRGVGGGDAAAATVSDGRR